MSWLIKRVVTSHDSQHISVLNIYLTYFLQYFFNSLIDLKFLNIQMSILIMSILVCDVF